MWNCLICFFLCLTTAVWSRQGDFEAVDRHALAATAKEESSIESLAAYLKQNRPRTAWNPTVKFQTRNYQGDEATAREIYRWIAERITYDYRSMGLKYKERSASEVLKRRFGVCQDYAVIYEALAKSAGLDVAVIYGSSLLNGKTGSHAWNAVNIGGEWRMIDSCWASKNGTWPEFQRNFESRWFTTPPEQFLETHFPEEVTYWGRDYTDFMRNMDQKHLNQIRRRFGLQPPPEWVRKSIWND